jgi:hypothetical protein
MTSERREPGGQEAVPHAIAAGRRVETTARTTALRITLSSCHPLEAAASATRAYEEDFIAASAGGAVEPRFGSVIAPAGAIVSSRRTPAS